jgi:hypothetical protein
VARNPGWDEKAPRLMQEEQGFEACASNSHRSRIDIFRRFLFFKLLISVMLIGISS